MADRVNYYLSANGQLVEVTKEVYSEYYRYQRQELYQAEQEKENGVQSYDALDNGEITGEAMFADRNTPTPEDEVIANEELNLLLSSIKSLSTEEQKLIYALYYENRSQRRYANDVGLSKSGVAYRRNQILEKLRKLMNIL